jgi:lipopolysaccharide export system protein LptA
MIKKLSGVFFLAPILIALAGPAVPQSASISLGAEKHDATLPVEVTADSLSVESSSNTATFKGNARAGQGELRLAAEVIVVTYAKDGSRIEQIEATRNVMFTNGVEIAEANKAVYRVADELIVMTGNVVLLQGQNAISGDDLTLDLATSKGVIKGNVKSVFVPKDPQ